MTPDSDDVARLRRVVYGPGAGVEERAEAEAALRELVERSPDVGGAVEAEPVSDGKAQARLDLPDAAKSSGDVAEGASVSGEAEAETAESIWRRRIRVGWLAPIVAGAFVVGVLGALQVTGQFAPRAQFNGPYLTSPSAPPEDGSERIPGDLEAADTWCADSATASDAYPFLGLLESNGIDPYEVRFALAGGEGWNVWVGRAGAGELCLLIADAADQSGAAGCVERVQFARGGMHLVLNGRTADWYGDEVTMASSGSSLDDPNSNSTPPVPAAGPGSLEGANAWFARPAQIRDKFPYPKLLPSLGIDGQQVRYVASGDDSSHSMWVAKQAETGFCLLSADVGAGTSHYSCVRLEQFLASGVSLATPGLSVYWGGDNVSATG